MTKMLLGCGLLALAAGCATTSPATPERKAQVRVVEMSALRDTTLSPDKTYVCEEGARTGSKQPTAICQTVRQRELQREAAQEQLHRMQMSGAARR